MAEIIGLSIDNFKVFEASNKFSLSNILLTPITIITGQNNSGKSSI